MAWYTIVLIVCVSILAIQVVLSFILGDLDIDTDLHFEFGHFDLGDLLSVKGMLHFIIGVTLTLTLFGGGTLLVWALGVIVGIIFATVFGWLYRSLYKGLEQIVEYKQNFVDEPATVYYYDFKSQKGQARLTLEGATRELPFSSDTPVDLKYGDAITLSGTRFNLKLTNNK